MLVTAHAFDPRIGDLNATWKYYFLIGAILILILAKVECSTFKSGGILKTEYSFNLFGCVLIFLLIGLKIIISF